MFYVATLLATVMRAADPKNVRQGTCLRNREAGINREAIALGHRLEARLWRRKVDRNRRCTV